MMWCYHHHASLWRTQNCYYIFIKSGPNFYEFAAMRLCWRLMYDISSLPNSESKILQTKLLLFCFFLSVSQMLMADRKPASLWRGINGPPMSNFHSICLCTHVHTYWVLLTRSGFIFAAALVGTCNVHYNVKIHCKALHEFNNFSLSSVLSRPEC